MASRTKKQPSEPPLLPELRRRLRFGVGQVVGLAFIVLIPIAALFRLFGQGESHVGAQSGPVKLAVEYPPRLRHGTAEVIVVGIANSGPVILDTVTVIFDSSYVSGVSEPRFVPPATRAFELDLPNVKPGESRRIELAFYADEYWTHRGRIRAIHASDTAVVNVATFVFP